MSSNGFNFDLSQVSQPSSSADQAANAFVYATLDTQYFSQQDHQVRHPSPIFVAQD